MRGHIDLSGHKLANLYRAPARSERWKSYRPPIMHDETFRQIVRLVDGAVRDAFANHPEFLTKAGQRNARASIVKRVAGTLWGYGKQASFAAQAARGRSIVVVDASPTMAAEQDAASGKTLASDDALVSNGEPHPAVLTTEAVLGGGGTFVPADNLQLSFILEPPAEFGVGVWYQRNGNLAEITKRLTLNCKGPDGPFLYDVWAGHCLCHGAKFTWHLDGRYAAVGTHEFDLVMMRKI